MERNWTEQVFVDHGQLYLRFLEAALPRAPQEAESIHKLLEKHQVGLGSRLLDLSCGIGRHSVELARLGYRVTGIDLSPTFIARAKRLAQEKQVTEKVAFHICDARRVAQTLANEKFDAIVNIFTSFGYYDEETNTDILRQCRTLVREGGIFVMDVINRDGLVRRYQPQGFTHAGDVLLLLEERKINFETGRNNTTWTFLRELSPGNFKQEARVTLDHRLYNLHELIRDFTQAGWEYREVYGSLNLEPFDIASTRIVGVFGT